MKVVLYHQHGCGMCKAVEMLLQKKNIDYESVTDVDEMLARGVTGTPTLDVDDKRFVKRECLDWINQQR